ncbi:MAG: diguanylate cyclase [Clostridia bacterium]|nr:diguanylate cyclase [Clostridia bacterium]
MFREQLYQTLNKYFEGNTLDPIIKEISQIYQYDLNEKMYEAAFDLAPVALVILDNDMEVLEMNQQAKYLLGDMKGLNFKGIIHQKTLDLYEHYIQKFSSTSFSLPIHLELNIENEIKYIKMVTKRIDKLHLQTAIVDESFEQSTLNQLEILSFKDHLTGLYNRRFFQEEMNRLDVKRNYPIGLILVDVNGLKLINDAFGHLKGDELIKTTAQVLLDSCRQDDVVARIGGDEFGIILPRTEKAVIDQLLKRINHEISKKYIGDIQLSIACGYSIKNGNMDSFDHLFKRAEDAMYKDKLVNSSSQRVEIINGILATLHEKHKRERLHSKSVSDYMIRLGEAMGFGSARLSVMASAGLLHDIGKIAIDYSLLEQERALTEAERLIVNQHAEIGYRILKSTATFGDIAEIVLYHHENMDGTGYPKGLKGSEIPLESRMLNICDAFDTMINHPLVGGIMSKNEAIAELKAKAGKQFDKLLVEIFINKVL